MAIHEFLAAGSVRRLSIDAGGAIAKGYVRDLMPLGRPHRTGMGSAVARDRPPASNRKVKIPDLSGARRRIVFDCGDMVAVGRERCLIPIRRLAQRPQSAPLTVVHIELLSG